MKKSFTSTCQSFLLHSMLTLITVQATHATEQLIHKANNSFNKGIKNDQTIEYYKKVIQQAKPNSLLVAHAQNQLGNMYTKEPYVSYDKAEQSYLSALSIYEKGDDNFFLAEIKLNLAILYLDKQKAYDKAIKNFKEAIEYYSKEKPQKRKIAVSHSS